MENTIFEKERTITILILNELGLASIRIVWKLSVSVMFLQLVIHPFPAFKKKKKRGILKDTVTFQGTRSYATRKKHLGQLNEFIL